MDDLKKSDSEHIFKAKHFVMDCMFSKHSMISTFKMREGYKKDPKSRSSGYCEWIYGSYQTLSKVFWEETYNEVILPSYRIFALSRINEATF